MNIYIICFLLILTFSINVLVALLPSNNCVAYEKSCTIASNNLIRFYTNISHIDECDLLCAGEFECKVSSYFGPDSYPATNSCVLLKFCSNLDDCNNCYTHEKDCYNNCDALIEGNLSENNILDEQPEIADTITCKELCDFSKSCMVYTYYGETSTIFSKWENFPISFDY